MSNRIVALVACAALVLWTELAAAQPSDGKFSTPPDGFDTRRDDIERGKLELVEYESTTVGTQRKAQVYTPPGYSQDRTYPVLYLLHGIGGDEHEWVRGGSPHVILDNLYADKKLAPMIVVMAQVSKVCDTHEPDAMKLSHSKLPTRLDLFSATLGHLRHALLNPEATAESCLLPIRCKTVALPCRYNQWQAQSGAVQLMSRRNHGSSGVATC